MILMIVISVSFLLTHLVICWVCYNAAAWTFRLLNPNLRWEQKGNVCYDDKSFWGWVGGVSLYILLLAIVYDLIKFEV